MNTPTEHTAQLRHLIQHRSKLANGFSRYDAADHTTAQVSKLCCRMVEAGQLHKMKVLGWPTCFHATAEGAAAFKVRSPQKPVRPHRPNLVGRRERGQALAQLILTEAALPEGFQSKAEDPLQWVGRNKKCWDMAKQGLLCKARSGHSVRWFVNQALADAWLLLHPPIVRRVHRAEVSDAPKAKRSKAVKPPVVVRVKPPPVIARKPYAPPVPRRDAVIVYPEKYMRTSRMMVDRYAVHVPFIRIGQAGFSMSVGGAA